MKDPISNNVAEYIIYIPLYYNDGKKIEKDKVKIIIEQILNKFGGLTREKVNDGFWIYKNKTYSDKIDKLTVLTHDSKENDTWFKKFKNILKKQLKQKDIYLVKNFSLEIL